MEPYLAQPVTTLSGGEMQRAFLAQLFAQDPEMLILDEPTNHLDLRYQKQIFALVEAWRKKKKGAVISVVHDLSMARLYGTKVLLLDAGQVVACGEKEEVLAPQYINRVYDMDVGAWMRNLYEIWKEGE